MWDPMMIGIALGGFALLGMAAWWVVSTPFQMLLERRSEKTKPRCQRVLRNEWTQVVLRKTRKGVRYERCGAYLFPDGRCPYDQPYAGTTQRHAIPPPKSTVHWSYQQRQDLQRALLWILFGLPILVGIVALIIAAVMGEVRTTATP